MTWILILEVLSDFLGSDEEILKEAFVVIVSVQVSLGDVQVADFVLNIFVELKLREFLETSLENFGSMDLHFRGFLNKRFLLQFLLEFVGFLPVILGKGLAEGVNSLVKCLDLVLFILAKYVKCLDFLVNVLLFCDLNGLFDEGIWGKFLTLALNIDLGNMLSGNFMVFKVVNHFLLVLLGVF